MAESTKLETLDITIRAKDEATIEAERITKQLKEQARELAKQEKAAGKALGADFIGDDSGKILRSAGLAGTGILATSGLKDLTAELMKARDEMGAVKQDAAELADSLLRSIPVVKEGYEIGRNIRELLTDEAAQAEHRAKIEKEINAAWMERKQAVADVLKLQEEAAERIKKLQQEAYLASLPPSERAAAAAGFAGENALGAFDKQAAEARKKLAGGYDKDIAARFRERDDAARRGMGDEADQAERMALALQQKRDRELAKLDEQTAEERKAIAGKAERERSDALAAEFRRREQIADEHAERLKDIDAEMKEEAMRAAGDAWRADASKIRREAEKELKAARDRAKREGEETGDVQGATARLGEEVQRIREQREQRLDLLFKQMPAGLGAGGRAAGGAVGFAMEAMQMAVNAKPAGLVSPLAGGASAASFGGTGVGVSLREQQQASQYEVMRKQLEEQKKMAEQQKKMAEMIGRFLPDVGQFIKNVGVG